MGLFKGKRDLEKYREGRKLNLKHSVWAKCFECNGFEEGGIDCGVPGCPICPYNPYRDAKPEKEVSR
jgi:hypothetical protein